MKQIATTSGPKSIGLLSVGAYRPSEWSPTMRYARTSSRPMSGSIPEPGSRRADSPLHEESAASMAIEAGRRAISNASLDATDIDGVIVATSTHFLQTPPVPRRSQRRWALRASRIRHLGGVCRLRVRARRRGRHDPGRNRRQDAGHRLGETVPHHRHAGPQQLLHLRRRCSREWWWARHPCKALDRPSGAVTVNRPLPYARTSTGSLTRRTQPAHARFCVSKAARSSVGRHSKWARWVGRQWTQRESAPMR